MQKFDITIYLGFKTYLNSSQCFPSWELEFKCNNIKVIFNKEVMRIRII